MLYQFHWHAAGRLRVEKRHPVFSGYDPGGSVYRLEACSREPVQLAFDVTSAVRDYDVDRNRGGRESVRSGYL